jgi:hypothetical protein
MLFDAPWSLPGYGVERNAEPPAVPDFAIIAVKDERKRPGGSIRATEGAI